MNFDDQGQENGLTASTPRHDLTMTENLHTFVRDDTIPPSPTSDDNQSATATPTKDTVTPDVKAAKRKAAAPVEGQPRQGKAVRRLTSTFGDSARAAQVAFLTTARCQQAVTAQATIPTFAQPPSRSPQGLLRRLQRSRPPHVSRDSTRMRTSPAWQR